MKDTYLSARLIAPDTIRIVIFSSIQAEKLPARFFVDHLERKTLTPSRVLSTTSTLIADYKLDASLELGHSYELALIDYGMVGLDVSEATSFPRFDEDYFYGGKLGNEYSPKETVFTLWAPLASSVILKIQDKGASSFSYFIMKREERGVYRLSLKGNHELALYHFLVTNNEITTDITDPYATCSTPNAKDSVVADWNKLQADFHRDDLPSLPNRCSSIIYEANVRDLTIDPHSDIVHKGTFKGLSEEGRKTEGGMPAGFDYIVSLGITHLQLQPLYDFETVDETNPLSKYNWGYDPEQYFVPEGSYGSDVNDPYSRIKELQELVGHFHSKGVRIVMDVVFNHVYEYSSSVFERAVPNFYFRRRSNGKMANTSGCGNDLASERPMVRKMIVDASEFWIDHYGVDGFRFDLMGIVDVTTLNIIREMAHAKNQYFLTYGEGWNMGGEAKVPLGTMDNYKLLPDYSFFNDKFRDPVRRWACGDSSSDGSFKFAYVSSSINFFHAPIFSSARQTINYIECHDNNTFYDYVSSSRGDLSVDERLKICTLGLAIVMTSYGLSFIHMGQEIGMSKWGNGNTYNLPDVYNKFSYKLLDERVWMYHYFVGLVKLRKACSLFRIYDPRVLDTLLDIKNVGPVLEAIAKGEEFVAPYKELDFLYNPSDNASTVSFSEDRVVLFDDLASPKGFGILSKNVVLPAHSLMVVGLPPEKESK